MSGISDQVRGEIAIRLQERNRFIDMATMRTIVDEAIDATPPPEPSVQKPVAWQSTVHAHCDTLGSCLESFWCLTSEGTDDRLLAEGALDAVRGIRSAIGVASPSPAGDRSVKAKALEWVKAALDGKFGWLIIRYAQTPFGRYYVEKFASANYRVSLNEQVLTSILPSSVDEAIAAAQADYEARILSALTSGADHE